MYDNRIFEIEAITKGHPFLNTIEFGARVVEWKNLQPIPLTEELLLRFGFVRNKTILHIENILLLKLFGSKFEVKFYTDASSFATKPCREIYISYVHQLQNLFYSLTNQELKLEGL